MRRSLLTNPVAPPPNVLYLWLIILVALLLTLAAIGGCVVLYVGSREFTVQARKVEHALKDAAGNATATIDGLTEAIVDVEQLLEPFSNDASISGISLGTFNSTQVTLSRESKNINHTVHKNTRILDRVITALEIVFMVVASLNLILIIVAPVVLLLHWNRTFYLILTTAWTLTVLTAVLFGISFVLDNLVSDTCDAISEYRADPYNTTLDSLFSCEDLLSASGALAGVGKGIRDSLTQVNDTIVQDEGPLSSSLPALCEPIGPPPSYQYFGSCPNGTVPISELPQVLKTFRCASNDTQTCNQQGKFITDFQYMELVAYSTGVQTLLNVYPTIDRLTDCSIVSQTFDSLLKNNCGPLTSAGHLVWDAFLCLVVSMILLILWWLVLNGRSRERKTVIFPIIGSPQKHKSEN